MLAVIFIVFIKLRLSRKVRATLIAILLLTDQTSVYSPTNFYSFNTITTRASRPGISTIFCGFPDPPTPRYVIRQCFGPFEMRDLYTLTNTTPFFEVLRESYAHLISSSPTISYRFSSLVFKQVILNKKNHIFSPPMPSWLGTAFRPNRLPGTSARGAPITTRGSFMNAGSSRAGILLTTAL